MKGLENGSEQGISQIHRSEIFIRPLDRNITMPTLDHFMTNFLHFLNLLVRIFRKAVSGGENPKRVDD